MFKAFLHSSKRSTSSDSLSGGDGSDTAGELKLAHSAPSIPSSVTGSGTGRQGKENRHERMQSASAILTMDKDAKKASTKTWTGPAPVLDTGAPSDNGKGKGASMGAGAKVGNGRVVDRERMMETNAVQEAFEKMLDELQIPESIRPKLNTLEPPVKAAMLRSSKTLDFLTSATPAPPAPGTAARSLRKSRSHDSVSVSASPKPKPVSIVSPRKRKAFDSPPATPRRKGSKPPFEESIVVGGSPFTLVAAGDVSLASPRGGARPSSMDATHAPPLTSFSSFGDLDDAPPKAVVGKSRTNSKEKALTTPAAFAAMLAGTRGTVVDVERVKKLRLMLRNEPASWTEEFLCHGGYIALLARLKDVFDVEWRDEQHDDQALHELLRCLKALSTSAIGSFALRSSCPTPFASLVELMYSDKKPGDVATRQLMVELYLILFELYPTRASAPSRGPGTPTSNNSSSGSAVAGRRHTSIFPLPSPHDSLFSLLRALLLTKPPPRAEAALAAEPPTPHAFIASLHTPRIYRPYLAEMSDICRDYFWVFCHPGNTVWALEEVDDGVVERPRAPGGMTGGVEFEAMNYLTTHLRFLNALAKSALELNLPPTAELSAHRLHEDLFASGLERILATVRKASTTYYPTLHLELARYVRHCALARYELPWSLARLVGTPPSPMRKRGLGTPDRSRSGAATGASPSKRPQGGRPPMLPATPRLEAIRM